jgi:hypothetical protein
MAAVTALCRQLATRDQIIAELQDAVLVGDPFELLERLAGRPSLAHPDGADANETPYV